jgi:hypothetical protein
LPQGDESVGQLQLDCWQLGLERVAQEREGPVVDEDLVDPSILSKADFWSQEANWKSIHELLAGACKNIELKVIHSGPAAAF